MHVGVDVGGTLPRSWGLRQSAVKRRSVSDDDINHSGQAYEHATDDRTSGKQSTKSYQMIDEVLANIRQPRPIN